MPLSSNEGKAWTRDRIGELGKANPVTVLDIGPGAGTYAKLLAGPAVAKLTGIEIYPAYVETYRLHQYYDEIIIGDARSVEFPSADVVIIGDVAEHMTEADAVALWDKAARAASVAVYLSIPIVHYPQGEIEGNHHEVHVVDDWNHERVLAGFAGITDWWTGTEIGVYERRLTASPDPAGAVREPDRARPVPPSPRHR